VLSLSLASQKEGGVCNGEAQGMSTKISLNRAFNGLQKRVLTKKRTSRSLQQRRREKAVGVVSRKRADRKDSRIRRGERKGISD